MSATVAYVSRPELLVDGQRAERLNNDLQALLVEETTDGLFRCEARLNNFGGAGDGYLYFARDRVDFGAALTVRMGLPGEARAVFEGRVSALEADYPPGGGSVVVVLAEDRLQELRMARRSRAFEDTSDEDVVRQIAAEHGLTAQVSLPGPRHVVLAQLNQSDLAFLRARACSLGGELWVEGTTLHASTRGERDAGSVELAYGGHLLSFTVRADLAHQCTDVGVGGWDVAAKEGIEETAGAATVAPELNGGTSGSAVLQEALSPRHERVVRAAPATSAEARSLAEAHYLARARRFVTGTAVSDGDARLRVGTRVRLSGLGALFNGAYYLTRVRHEYDDDLGFRTEFDVERADIGRG